MKLICSDLKYLYERKVRDNRLVKVSGWIKSTRESAEYFFAEINDGSVFHNTNLFFEKKFFDLREIKKINICAGITVKGIFKNTPERKHSFEIVVKTIETVSPTNGDFPIQKKKSSLDFLREIPHLRLKTSYFLAVFRIKSYICSLIHDFFLKKNFIYLTTPVLTSIDGEGAGEMFSVDSEKGDFFARKANLTVSGQLQLEAFVQGLGKVYNFSPCFRAEKSKTTRHLSEFWMVEAEMIASELEEIINLSESLIKFVSSNLLKKKTAELNYLSSSSFNTSSVPLKEKLKILANMNNFKRIEYTECIEILKNSKYKFQNGEEPRWGMDLQSEHEKYLCDYFKGPVFVVNYPKEFKAFYMKQNNGRKTVSCFDLLVPGIGELVGGSLREDFSNNLLERIKETNLEKSLNWYVDMRKSGYLRSGGFGIGVERLIMYLCGLENIKDATCFPRFYKNLSF